MAINMYVARYKRDLDYLGKPNPSQFVFRAEIDGYAKDLALDYIKLDTQIGHLRLVGLARLNLSTEEIPIDNDGSNLTRVDEGNRKDLERKIMKAGFVELKDAIFSEK